MGYRGLEEVTGGYWGLKGVIGAYRGLKGVTGGIALVLGETVSGGNFTASGGFRSD